MTMFLVEAEHPTVPGIVRSLHTTRTAAEKAAGELCDQIATDLGLKGCTAVNGLETMQGWINEWSERDDAEMDDSAYVVILELPADEPIATNLLRRMVDHYSAVCAETSLVREARAYLTGAA